MRRVGEPVPEKPVPEAGCPCGHDAGLQKSSSSETTAAVTEENPSPEQRVTTPQGLRKKKG